MPGLSAAREATLVGLTNLISRDAPMPPKLNRRRALFVLAKIDQILAWEREVDNQRDTRFVELGRYLCEVRSSNGVSPNHAARPTTSCRFTNISRNRFVGN